MRITQTDTTEAAGLAFRLDGDFELTDVAALERHIGRRRRGDRVMLDTRGLRFLDSSALALLLRLQRLADEDGWSVAIVPGDALMQRARRTGLETILRFVDPALSTAPEAAPDA